MWLSLASGIGCLRVFVCVLQETACSATKNEDILGTNSSHRMAKTFIPPQALITTKGQAVRRLSMLGDVTLGYISFQSHRKVMVKHVLHGSPIERA